MHGQLIASNAFSGARGGDQPPREGGGFPRRDHPGVRQPSGALFLALYTVFIVGLRISAPGYIEAVWVLDALSGVAPAGIPLEELLFAVTFGMY